MKKLSFSKNKQRLLHKKSSIRRSKVVNFFSAYSQSHCRFTGRWRKVAIFVQRRQRGQSWAQCHPSTFTTATTEFHLTIFFIIKKGEKKILFFFFYILKIIRKIFFTINYAHFQKRKTPKGQLLVKRELFFFFFVTCSGGESFETHADRRADWRRLKHEIVTHRVIPTIFFASPPYSAFGFPLFLRAGILYSRHIAPRTHTLHEMFVCVRIR